MLDFIDALVFKAFLLCLDPKGRQKRIVLKDIQVNKKLNLS
jgi:hypothetical protein